MPLYLTLSRGPRADQAVPILASSDRCLIEAVLAAVSALGGEEEPTPASRGSIATMPGARKLQAVRAGARPEVRQ